MRAERRTLSALGRPVPYYLLSPSSLTEAARDRCLVRLPAAYHTLQACHRFNIEKDPVFSYKSRNMVSNPEYRFWAVVYAERKLRLCGAALMTVYIEHQLLYVTPDVIAFARELGMRMTVTLSSRANVRKFVELFEIIESTRFEQLSLS